jgi:signal transduction histidine kinase
MNLSRLPLLWKIWLSTSVALTLLFVMMGIYLQRTVQQSATAGLLDEARASSQAYDAVLESRAETLRSLAAILSAMPEPAPGENWLTRVAGRLEPSTFVETAEPDGARREILLGDAAAVPDTQPLAASAAAVFPRPSSGFYVDRGTLYQVAVTPVYAGEALASVLVTGYVLNHEFAQRLKLAAGKSEFILASRGQIYASTLDDRATGNAVRSMILERKPGFAGDGRMEYVPLARDLVDIDGKLAGRLFVLRSFEEAKANIASLRQRILIMWLAAVVAGLGLTYAAARRLVRPLQDLDRAASEVSMENYDTRVPVDRDDELGRLAESFNKMCDSLRQARAELIRRERIAAIGRIAGSIVHDLRNPLAAIYGGAEMLVDTALTPEQSRRIAENIHRSSKRIQQMLDDLVRVARGGTVDKKPLPLRSVIDSALAALEAVAMQHKVRFEVEVPQELEVMADPSRLHRVFLNLVQNSLDVLPDGGRVRIRAESEHQWAMVEVVDDGPGIPAEVRGQLFQPFTSHGKKYGLGLGLALARQTVLDHGGDLWASHERNGARFVVRLPRRAGAA